MSPLFRRRRRRDSPATFTTRRFPGRICYLSLGFWSRSFPMNRTLCIGLWGSRFSRWIGVCWRGRKLRPWVTACCLLGGTLRFPFLLLILKGAVRIASISPTIIRSLITMMMRMGSMIWGSLGYGIRALSRCPVFPEVLHILDWDGRFQFGLRQILAECKFSCLCLFVFGWKN